MSHDIKIMPSYSGLHYIMSINLKKQQETRVSEEQYETLDINDLLGDVESNQVQYNNIVSEIEEEEGVYLTEENTIIQNEEIN